MCKKIILALNGELQGDYNDYSQIIKSQDTINIGVDGGSLLLEKIGLMPDVVIGDLDSLSQEVVQNYLNKGVQILKYPVDKDETDGELALEYCLNHDYRDIIIIGSMGGRFDQQLANLFLLEFSCRFGLHTVIREPDMEIGLIDDYKKFEGLNNSALSLVPFTEKVENVNISGFKYNLKDEDLYRYRTRGISNRIINDNACISLKEGLLLYVLREFS